MIVASHGIIGSSIVQFDPNAFLFSVKTDNTGVSTSTQFRMPLTTSTGLNFDVDWGDGTVENITDHTLAIHTYPSAGTYTISVTGNILGWQFNNSGDALKILNIFQWKALNISVNGGFYGCNNLTCSAIDAPVITSTSLASYFESCTNFNGAIGNWDVSLVTNMQFMFRTSSVFNQNIGAWDVSNVTNFESMFSNATAFNNGGLDDIDDWIFSSTSDISMVNMFGGTLSSLTCKFNRYIGSWNTGRVVNMNSMFFRNTLFNQDIGAWDVSNVTNMGSMFRESISFNQDISDWDISNVTSFFNFMLNVTLSTTNYDLLLVEWESEIPKSGVNINFGGSKYTLGSAAQTARASLIATYGWTITDGGPA
jgi:surface protein